MKYFVSELIERKKKRYKEDYSEMLGDFNREIETVKGYNGRQILELLQNCDDEGAKKVLIKLDADLSKITISNDGQPFSEKGYRSLFIANLSSKTTKRKYIGNKGLGFRSIINWSNNIEIQSNNISLIFSEDNLTNSFNKLFPKELQNKIRDEENLSESVTPLPFLSMPILKDIVKTEYVTSIIVNYKDEFLEDIRKQVDKITSETLLFLRNIEEIKFEGFENKDNINCKREEINADVIGFIAKGKIIFNNNSWYIFEEEKLLPQEFSDSNKNEGEFYQIKIAVEENLEHSSPYLYSFFPTNIKLDQPYVLHATFDLDATRNQINDSLKNKYILEKIVAFTIEVAKYYSTKTVSYKPLMILNHSHKADTLDNLGYYNLIENAIKTESIFPCVDNTYKKLEDAIYISEDFASMLLKISANEIIDMHLLPIQEGNLKDFILSLGIDTSLNIFESSLELVNNIASLGLSVYERALFISQIVKTCQFLKTKFPNKINFLINGNGKLISGNDYIYTPITFDNSLKIPIYTNIEFIDTNLFSLLVKLLNHDAKENPNKGRFIYDQLKGFCNIHSYEPTTLALKIISETNNIIKENPTETLVYIREMNRCLFVNYKKSEVDTIKTPISTNVPTFTKNKTVKPTSEVSLSAYYPTGKKTELIFSDVYSDDNYIASPEELGIVHYDSIHDVEDYLIWLSVNKFVHYVNGNTTDTVGYFSYVMRYKGNPASTGQNLSFKRIDNFELLLNRLSLNKLIIWIYFDEILRKQLSNDLNDDVVRNHYRAFYEIYNKPSYIKFILDTKHQLSFKNILIDERYYWINDFNIDYTSKDFAEAKITKTSINEILILLGAKDDFNEISIDKLTEIINKLPQQYPDGKKSQSIYKRALNHYRIHNKEINKPLNLFADNGTQLKLYAQEEIYFNDKIKLPKRLKQDFPIFNFPVRAGGAEAIKFFGINDLNELKVEILSHNSINEITLEFSEYFQKLKPLILTQRINVIEETRLRKQQASICNKIKIILCSAISYKVLDKEYEVANYEFLHYKEETYFLKINEFDSLQFLRKHFHFTDSFADILSLSFDISGDKNEFKHLLRTDFDYAILSTKNDFGNDTLQEARELLGLADYKQAFWQAVFQAKELEYFEHLDDLSLENLLRDNLNITFNLSELDYENLSIEVQLKKVESLFNEINIELEQFALKYPYKISVKDVHFKLLRNVILSKKNKVKTSVWKSISAKEIEIQAKFLSEINKYEYYESFANQIAIENEYHFSINTDKIVNDYIFSIYGDLEITEELNINKYRNQNILRFSEDELFEISQNERFKSLLYFDNVVEIIKDELIKLQSKQIEKPNSDSRSTSYAYKYDKPTIISSDKLKQKKIDIRLKSKYSGVYTPKQDNSRKLKEIGNSSEKLVYDHLLESEFHKNVYWASEDNEGLHYDIRYTNSENILKYVEVKTFDNSYFHLSKAEYDFGLNHKDDYEIWLVNNKKNIIPITDFFSNKKYEVISNEYLVYLDLSDN